MEISLKILTVAFLLEHFSWRFVWWGTESDFFQRGTERADEIRRFLLASLPQNLVQDMFRSLIQISCQENSPFCEWTRMFVRLIEEWVPEVFGKCRLFSNSIFYLPCASIPGNCSRVEHSYFYSPLVNSMQLTCKKTSCVYRDPLVRFYICIDQPITPFLFEKFLHELNRRSRYLFFFGDLYHCVKNPQLSHYTISSFNEDGKRMFNFHLFYVEDVNLPLERMFSLMDAYLNFEHEKVYSFSIPQSIICDHHRNLTFQNRYFLFSYARENIVQSMCESIKFFRWGCIVSFVHEMSHVVSSRFIKICHSCGTKEIVDELSQNLTNVRWFAVNLEHADLEGLKCLIASITELFEKIHKKRDVSFSLLEKKIQKDEVLGNNSPVRNMFTLLHSPLLRVEETFYKEVDLLLLYVRYCRFRGIILNENRTDDAVLRICTGCWSIEALAEVNASPLFPLPRLGKWN